MPAQGRDTLLIAPTGGGKTLAGFLPSLVDLARRAPKRKPETAIHTLYVSPLKALAVDIARNLAMPVAEMELPIRLETRTGDTPPSRRARQRVLPPDILLTTPEQIALMLSHKGAAELFGSLKYVILDELHALASSKRGDLLALDLARLRTHSPETHGDRPVGDGGAALRACLFPRAASGADRDATCRDRHRGRGSPRRHCHPALKRRAALGGAFGALCAAGDLRGDQGASHVADLRQYALAGRDAVP